MLPPDESTPIPPLRSLISPKDHYTPEASALNSEIQRLLEPIFLSYQQGGYSTYHLSAIAHDAIVEMCATLRIKKGLEEYKARKIEEK